MVHKNSNRKKNVSQLKPAVITIDVPGDGARTIEAQHYVRADDGTVSIYTGPRSDGIDYQVHISRCVIRRVDELTGYEDAFSDMFDGVDEIQWGDDDQELTTDGRENTTYDPYDSYDPVADRGCGELDIIGETITITKCLETVRQWLVTPSGPKTSVDDVRDVSYEDCPTKLCVSFGNQSKLVEIPFVADANPDDEIPVATTVEYSPMNAPAITQTIQDLIEDLKDDGDKQEKDSASERSLVADGGQVIETGVVVEHDGDQYRVARVGTNDVEIYKLGRGSRIVSLADVARVPEVEA